MCAYESVYACGHVCLCFYVFLFVHGCICGCVCVCVCGCVFKYLQVCMYVYANVLVCACASTCVCVRVCVYGVFPSPFSFSSSSVTNLLNAAGNISWRCIVLFISVCYQEQWLQILCLSYSLEIVTFQFVFMEQREQTIAQRDWFYPHQARHLPHCHDECP